MRIATGQPRGRTTTNPEQSLAEFDDDNDNDDNDNDDNDNDHRSKPRSHILEDIIHHLETLSSQLESALEPSRSLRVQQATAQNTIQLLELKVTELQQLVQITDEG